MANHLHNGKPMIRELQRYLQWDVRTWSRAILYWEDVLGNTLQGKECLEIGCGGGGLSLWATRKGMRVVCSDLKDTEINTLEIRRKLADSASFAVEDIDALAIPYAERFDVVIFKSILGGIGRNGRYDLQRAAIGQVLRCLKPGGLLLFAENLQGSRFHSLMRRAFVRWGREWRYVTLAEIHNLLAAFTEIEVKTCGFIAAFGVFESLRRILSLFDRLFWEKITPAKMHYVAFGTARKKLEQT